jgi:hypothetical protein
MPPKGKAPLLKKDQIELIRRWIDGGANWPDKVELTPPAGDDKVDKQQGAAGRR